MSSHKNRIAQLEKRARPGVANPYMTMPLERFMDIMGKIQRGEALHTPAPSPAAEAMRQDILQRLERIAEAQRYEQP